MHSIPLLPAHWAVAPDSGRDTASTDSPLWRQAAIDTLRVPISKLVLRGHEKRVHSVAFSPDGNKIVSGSADKTVRIWNAESGALLGSPMEHARRLREGQWSSDGRMLVTLNGDDAVQRWDATLFKTTGPIVHHGAFIQHLAITLTATQVVGGAFVQGVSQGVFL